MILPNAVIAQRVFDMTKIPAKLLIICQLIKMPPETRVPNPDRSMAHSGRAPCARQFAVSQAYSGAVAHGLNAWISPEGAGRLMIVVIKARRGQRLTWRCKGRSRRYRRSQWVQTKREQKSNSAFMETDEPIICRGLDHTAVCAVGHSLSKHMEHALPLCVRERTREKSLLCSEAIPALLRQKNVTFAIWWIN